MPPVSRVYDDLIDSGKASPDSSQRDALQRLDYLADQLTLRKVWSGGRKSLFRRQSWERPERGLYLWGGVGRGKTFLMDLFADSLPEGTVIRLHFHRFMNKVHERLRDLRGNENPLEMVADQLAHGGKVLCLDECFVSDITDAMVLGSVFDALFRRGMALVTTSNIEPRNLYEGGLQRDRFMPAISLIERHCEIFNLDSGTNYRLRTLKHKKLYHSPFDGYATDAIWNSILALVPEATMTEGAFVTINRRQLAVRFVAEDVVGLISMLFAGWDGRCLTTSKLQSYIIQSLSLEFLDYLRRAMIWRSVLYLVDEFYDRSVNLLLAADVAIEELYVTGG